MQTVQFTFNLNQLVNITPINCKGHIDGMMFDGAGEQYRVVYWLNGERSSIVVYARELEPVRGES